MKNKLNRTISWPKPTHLRVVSLAVLFAMFIGVSSVFAQSGGEFTLDWWTIDGGITSSGGNYVLTGNIDQPDDGQLTGDVYTLIGGFWVLLAPSISPPGDEPPIILLPPEPPIIFSPLP